MTNEESHTVVSLLPTGDGWQAVVTGRVPEHSVIRELVRFCTGESPVLVIDDTTTVELMESR